jgi:hypothetical protein
MEDRSSASDCQGVAQTIQVRATSFLATLGPMNHRRWGLLAGAGVILLGLFVYIGWTWRHPSVFEAYGDWGTGQRHAQVGKTVYVGMTFPGDGSGSVSIHGGDPHDLVDSTDAEFAYFLCTPGEGPEGSAIGMVSSPDVRESCGDLVPADNTTMSPAHQQLVIAITPGGPGVLRFRGLDLRYDHGWQTGTQRVGGDVWLRVDGRSRPSAMGAH